MSQQVPIATINRFIIFINRAKSILQKDGNRLHSHTVKFGYFLSEAEPLFIGYIRDVLKAHRGRLKNLNGVLLDDTCDILAAAGIAGDEDRYSKLLAWMLWPEGKPELALSFQKAWLEALGLRKYAKRLKKATKPKTQLSTINGRPDLVLDFREPNLVLVVEAKTGSEEHEVPSGEMQTFAYPKALRQSLKLKKRHPLVMVFLTPDGRKAANSRAICTTYETFIMAIVDAVNKMNVGLRWAYSFAITHLLENAVSDGRSSLSIIRNLLRRGTSKSGSLSDEEILSNVGILGRLDRAIKSGDIK